ncbi:Retrovirus-related Pol polyprotein from transposon 17.6 [Takifugu flavidus]|uniref:ribonuclease H n=1 Tax=Takifugu flavidus TaxID=433684 RepID=A0A5C6P8P5_9TELE|nr:Retrovirus-related Pol polyprotein from transposon 17.6 [Takifugu flavidus]
MDDIIVWGSTREEHDRRLRQVLDKTREVNLKLNKDKCEFGVKSLTFVGDVVSEEGVKPDPRKTSAINNMERPTNKDEVRRFLGMVTYLAKFVPQLSTQSAPLRSLLEQKIEWVWSHEQEQCFLKLKEILTQAPVLRFYDPEKSTRISADASQYGSGSVLLQQHEEQWLPVAYASRALTSAESRDCSTGTWQQTGQVQEEVAPRSYRVQVDSGLLLRRNRIDLQLQQSQRDTVAQEAVQQDTAGSAEPAGSGPDRADHGLTKVQASPPAAGLSRPKRHVQPPKRLIETC